ncbi:MAG: N-acetyltransferase [Caldimicrobium thiodismutans]|uniref:N-acetyltransferase n=1 Tax=Caldimicrobium thiodismutans TaxID=1653476 RepID=A0A2N7PIE8_9BACT|nr:MAG: N-acetyltransferase [Caldimicrobium thiodismutans]
MIIREVSEEDLEAFVEDYIKAYSDLKEYKYTSKKDIKNYFKWLYKRDKEGFFVAEVDGKIVGFAAGDANWINSEGEKVLEIHEIFVIPEMRGKGIGTKLIEKLLEYGKKKGLKLAELWVGEKNYKAIEFYKTLNFKETGHGGKWIRMIKFLNS